MAMNLESFHRAVEQLKSRGLALASNNFSQWEHLPLKPGASVEHHGLRVNAHGPGTDSTILAAATGLLAAGGQISLLSGGKGNMVLLDGGKNQRTPHITLNLYANNAVVYLNLDHMQPILQRPLSLQVTFYNGPDQLFYWGAGSSAVHSVHVLDGRGRSIVVKEDVMMSNDVYFRTHDGHSIVDLTDRRLCNPGGDIVLENHVWVGKTYCAWALAMWAPAQWWRPKPWPREKFPPMWWWAVCRPECSKKMYLGAECPTALNFLTKNFAERYEEP